MKKTFTILVADSNPNMRDLLRRELTSEGYKVAVAEDGGQVLKEIESDGQVDLLLFDLEMPDADGQKIFETTQKRNPPLPVIIHTFLTEERGRMSPDRISGETFIERSGNIEHLKSAIADMLTRFYP
jgi:CheY-like chemotaxis protein